MPPASQKADVRPITLIGPSGECTFNIRPEDLSWAEPVRINVVNTLGSAWVDSFGPGIGQITIAGHTGWSGGPAGGPDWEQQFKLLYDVAFDGWNEAVEASRDPQSVELLFVDTLDSRVARVAPKTFNLRRNKARPLLVQYNISFLVVAMVGAGGGASIPFGTPQSMRDQAQAAILGAVGSIWGFLQ